MEDKMSSYASDLTDYSGGGNYPKEIVIKKDVPNPLRLVDTPNGVERYYISWILCDDDKMRSVIIENEHEGKSAFSQMLGDRKSFYKGGILESIQDPITKKAKFIWEDKDPELLLVVAYNGDTSGKKGSWKPRETFVFNSVQRDPDVDEAGNMHNWCKENKHTKLLKMGPTAFKDLQDLKVIEGELSSYDVAYIKKGQGYNTSHKVVRSTTNVPNTIIGPLSAEEKEYVRYDLKEITALTKASTILKYARNRIDRIDKLLGTQWIKKLEEAQLKEAPVTKEGSNSNSQPEPEWVSQGVATPPPTEPMSQPNVTRSPRVPIGNQDVEPCGYCKQLIPKNSEICPHCRNTLLEACVNADCKKKFSVFSSECPYCHQQYRVG